MNLFTQLSLPEYSYLEMTVDYCSTLGKKRWTFLVQFNCHRYYNSLDDVYSKFLEVCPEDYEYTIDVRFEIKYHFD